MLDHDESNLHSLHLELAGSGLLDNDDIIVADIRDRPRLEQIFAETRPDLVLHAAAHKHLPLLERHPCEGVKTNVLGTQHLVDLAIKYGTSRFVLISTDKAADPTSVLGATKRLAEVIVQAAAASRSTRWRRSGSETCSVRAVPCSASWPIRWPTGEAITVTHPDVTRFFMTIEEAAGLVLEAAMLAEYAETFVLDMGEPVGIVDLVQKYAAAIHLPQIRIMFTGLRPGEKLNEKVFSDAEVRVPTAHPQDLGDPRHAWCHRTWADACGTRHRRRQQRRGAIGRPAAGDASRLPARPPRPYACQRRCALPRRVVARGLYSGGEIIAINPELPWATRIIERNVGSLAAERSAGEPSVRLTIEGSTTPSRLRAFMS